MHPHGGCVYKGAPENEGAQCAEFSGGQIAQTSREQEPKIVKRLPEMLIQGPEVSTFRATSRKGPEKSSPAGRRGLK